MIPQSASIGILEAVYTGNTEILGKRLNKLLKTTVSYYDTAQRTEIQKTGKLQDMEY